MSISRQNLSIVIVTIKSENVIHQCIKSINEDLPIIVIENSSNFKFKNDLEKKYKNLNCILSYKNLGMGSGNNLGIKFCKTDYVLIINPDVLLEDNAIDELILASRSISDFSILSPISVHKDYPNYELDKDLKILSQDNLPFKVKNVDGYAMLFNKKKLDKILKNKAFNIENNYFDESFFMFLENNDLCKRIIEKGENIFVVPKAKINHFGAKAVDSKYNVEVELSRNWHWIWSKFYFKKKHFGFVHAFFAGLPNFLLALLKFFFYFLINNKIRKKIYFNRASGFFNALIGNSSWYRPKLDD
jgi:GT2 family glycosyltransferase